MDVTDFNELKAGCSTEDIRQFVIQKFANIEKGDTELEARLSDSFIQLRAELRDSFVNGDEKFNDYATNEKYDKGLDDVNALKLRLNKFADTIQEWTLRTEAIEASFREHTDVAFHLVNVEVAKLKANIVDTQADIAKQRAQATMGSPATSAGEEFIRGQVRAMEKSVGILREMQDVHRAELDKQRDDLKAAEDGNLVLNIDVNTINADIKSIKDLSGFGGVGSGPPGMPVPSSGTFSATGGWSCHCPHLDGLEQRIQIVEAQSAAVHARATAAPGVQPPPVPDPFQARCPWTQASAPSASAAPSFCGTPGPCNHAGCGGAGGRWSAWQLRPRRRPGRSPSAASGSKLGSNGGQRRLARPDEDRLHQDLRRQGGQQRAVLLRWGQGRREMDAEDAWLLRRQDACDPPDPPLRRANLR